MTGSRMTPYRDLRHAQELSEIVQALWQLEVPWLIDDAHPLRRRLSKLGLACDDESLRVLAFAEPRMFTPTELATLRNVLSSPDLRRKLHRSRLGETLLRILSNPQLGFAITSSFVLELDALSSSDEARCSFAADSLLVAVESGLTELGTIADVVQFIKLGVAADAAINSTLYVFPSPPFVLSSGWSWMQTGADLQPQGPPRQYDPLRRVQYHHSDLVSGEAFLLRDASGRAWRLSRWPRSDHDYLPVPEAVWRCYEAKIRGVLLVGETALDTLAALGDRMPISPLFVRADRFPGSLDEIPAESGTVDWSSSLRQEFGVSGWTDMLVLENLNTYSESQLHMVRRLLDDTVDPEGFSFVWATSTQIPHGAQCHWADGMHVIKL